MGALLNKNYNLQALCNVSVAIFKLSRLFYSTSKDNQPADEEMAKDDKEEEPDEQFVLEDNFIFKGSAVKS